MSDPWASASGERPSGWPRGTGLLVVGHGTTDEEGAAECRTVGRMVSELLAGVPTALCFLELCEPSIEEGLAMLRRHGCREVVVAPLLLFAAGHAKRDVPTAVRTSAAHHGLVAREAGVLGLHEDLVRCSRSRLQEAAREADRAFMVFVGRGASDPTACPQMTEFARLVLAELGGGDREGSSWEGGEWNVGSVEDRSFGVGFVAAARPTLDEALEAAARDDLGCTRGFVGPLSGTGARQEGEAARVVVVHPHLLFKGHVEQQVAARVERARLDHPHIDWRVSRRLGADPLVARAVVGRALEAVARG